MTEKRLANNPEEVVKLIGLGKFKKIQVRLVNGHLHTVPKLDTETPAEPTEPKEPSPQEEKKEEAEEEIFLYLDESTGVYYDKDGKMQARDMPLEEQAQIREEEAKQQPTEEAK